MSMDDILIQRNLRWSGDVQRIDRPKLNLKAKRISIGSWQMYSKLRDSRKTIIHRIPTDC